MPTPLPIYGPPSHSEYIDMIDNQIKVLSDPNLFTIDRAIELSRQFTLPITMSIFHKRAKKCIFTDKGIEDVLKMRAELVYRGMKILIKKEDDLDYYFMTIPRNNDVWGIFAECASRIQLYIAAVNILANHLSLPIDVCRIIIEQAFNL